jgi:hypothetical protein
VMPGVNGFALARMAHMPPPRHQNRVRDRLR